MKVSKYIETKRELHLYNDFAFDNENSIRDDIGTDIG